MADHALEEKTAYASALPHVLACCSLVAASMCRSPESILYRTMPFCRGHALDPLLHWNSLKGLFIAGLEVKSSAQSIQKGGLILASQWFPAVRIIQADPASQETGDCQEGVF